MTVREPGSGELSLTGDLAEREDAFIRLAMLASAAHDRFVFEADDAAFDFYLTLYRRGAADFAPPAGRLLVVDGRPAGMVALVPPAALRRAHLVSAMVLARSKRELAATNPELVPRLELAARALARPGTGDGYLSRLAVHPAAGGRGLGQLLLHEAVSETRRLGLARCVLEVADTNVRAIALYERAGFREIGRESVTDPTTGATLGYRHMARDV